MSEEGPGSDRHMRSLLPMQSSILKSHLLLKGTLTSVSLMENNNSSWIGLPTFSSGLGRDAKAERHIRHGIDNDSSVAWRVLCYAPQARLEHVVAIQVLHLSGWLDPHLQTNISTLRPCRNPQLATSQLFSLQTDASPCMPVSNTSSNDLTRLLGRQTLIVSTSHEMCISL